MTASDGPESNGDSWLAEELVHEPYEAHLTRRGCRAALDWWRETTDVVILNSPWLRRSTGRALRCLWICIHLLRWLILLCFKGGACAAVRESSYMQLELATMLFCFARVLWVAIMTKRDGVWSGLLLCIGVLLSFNGVGALVTRVGGDDIGYAFVTLCHCNVHPMGICWVFLVSAVRFFNTAYKGNPTFTRFMVWQLDRYERFTCVSQFLLLCAFTMDFSNRIKAVASGMLDGSETGDSTASLALRSPVAGRSGRRPCWLAAFHNCLTFFLHLLFGGNVFTTAFLDGYACALLLCLLLALVACAWLTILDGLRSDIMLALLCHVPPTLFGILHYATRSDLLPFNYPSAAFAHFMQVVSTQVLIQAGCHPMVCALFALPLYIHTLWVCTVFGDHLSPYFTMHLATGAMVCSVLISSHCVDYSKRMKAIQRGLISSEENARSRERLEGGSMEIMEPLGLKCGPTQASGSSIPCEVI